MSEPLEKVYISRQDLKQIVKDAIREWLDEKFIMVGRWTVSGVVCMIIACFLYVMLKQKGFVMPHLPVIPE